MNQSRIINFESRKHLPYISATKLKNYILKDPIIDYFEFINNPFSSSSSSSYQKSNSIESSNYLCDLGNQFETNICNELKLKFKDDMIKISTNGRMGYNRENYNKTIKAIKDKIPIIEQAVLYNDKNGTCGIADLLVRNDYINKILNIPIDNDEIGLNEIDSDEPISYVVIDIKYTTLELCRDNKSIKNAGRIPSYKTQLAIYNMALAEIQNYLPSKAYILAKSYKSVNGIFNTYDKLGIIDYTGYDNWCDEEIKLAIDWLTDLMTTSSNWDINRPHRWELYPNMCNHYDDNYHNKKLEVSNNINELTLIWNVGFVNRIKAHNLNIFSYKDPRCDSITLGIKNRHNAEIIDNILDINRSDLNYYLIHGNELHNLPNINESCYYIDFETINLNINSQRSISIRSSATSSIFVFMIGVGHIVNNKWVFKTFQTNSLKEIEETRIFNEFINYVGINKILLHWSNAELSLFNNKINYLKINSSLNESLKLYNNFILLNNWFDLCKLFTNNIVLKGALDFKLKTIAKTLKKLNNELNLNLDFLNDIWESSGPQNGFDAMVQAIKFYSNGNVNLNSDLNNQIVKYNEHDCKILHSIHMWIYMHI